MVCINPNSLEFKEALKRTGNPLLAELEVTNLESVKQSTSFSDSLKNKLMSFLKDINIHVELNADELLNSSEFKNSPLAAFDVLQKFMAFASGQERLLPEQAAYVMYTFLGRKSSLSKALWKHIKEWENYDKVYNTYKNRESVDEDIFYSDDAFIDDEKFNPFAHKMAIVKFLEESLVKVESGEKPSVKRQNEDIDSEYFKKRGRLNPYQGTTLQKLFNKIYNWFKDLLSKPVFEKYSRADLSDLGLDIADDILKGNYTKYLRSYKREGDNIVDENGNVLELKDYEDTINKDSFAKSIIEKLVNNPYINFKLSGSLTLRKYGDLYRKLLEDLHDIDGVITLDTFNQDPKAFEFRRWLQTEGLRMMKTGKPKQFFDEIIPKLESLNWYQNLLGEFPGFKITNAFIGRDHQQGESVTVSGYIEHPTEKEVDEITGNEKPKKYVIDFFLRVDEGNYPEIFDNYWKDWKQIFEAKLNMGRSKDIADLVYFDPFIKDKFKFTNKGFRYFSFENLSQNKKSLEPSKLEKGTELTNVEFLQDLQTLPELSEDKVFSMLVGRDAVVGDKIKHDGKNYYKINIDREDIGQALGDITAQYGAILDYSYPEYVTVSQEFIDSWNDLRREATPASRNLNDLVRGFLTRIGVSISVQNDVIEKYGSNGIAEFANRIVRIQEGMEDEALPEEALHFFIDMMDQSDPALIEALDKIRQTDVYKETLAKYKNNPNYKTKDGQIRFDKIKKEALAKLLAQSMIAKDKINKDNKSWLENIIDKIISFVKGLVVRKSPFEIIEDAFYRQDISRLNMNLQSDEVYNQLTDERKAFYEAQLNKDGVTAEQIETVKKIFTHTSKMYFDQKTHTLVNTEINSAPEVFYFDDNVDPVEGKRIPGSTSKIGSDFYSELENSDIIEDILMSGIVQEAEKIGDEDISDLDDAAKVKKVVDYYINLLISEDEISSDETEQFLKDMFGGASSKAYQAIMNTKRFKENTLFGSAVHAVAESVILNKPIDYDNLDPILTKFLDIADLKKLFGVNVYGDKKSIGEILKDLVESGHVLMTEIVIGNAEVGGIIDIVAVDKKGVVKILDFKTKFIREFEKGDKDLEKEFVNQIKSTGNIGVKEDETVIPSLIGTKRSRLLKYTQQQSLYKSVLIDDGIPVGETYIIGIPYRVSEKTKKVSEISAVPVKLSYDSKFSDFLFPNIFNNDYLDKYDAEKVSSKEKLKEDERLKEVQKLQEAGQSENSLQSKFLKMMAELKKLHNYYSKNKDVKAVYELLRNEAGSNVLDLQLESVENALTNWDKLQDYLQVQLNFLKFIDETDLIVNTLKTSYESILNTASPTADARAQKINEMEKIKNMLDGYRQVLEGLIPSGSVTSDETGQEVINLDNPLTQSINKTISKIKEIERVHNNRIVDELVSILGNEFTEETFQSIKREFNEQIASAKKLGNKKRVEKLTQERDKLTSSNLIRQSLLGKTGDVHAFYSTMMATISNPDIVVSAFAKRVKSALNSVNLKNKDLLDEVGKEFDKRINVFGRSIDPKTLNQSLTYVHPEFNRHTGETVDVLYFMTEFDERLYSDENRLKYDLNKANEKLAEAEKTNNEENIAQARKELKKIKKKLRDFQVKYLQTDETAEYFRLTNMLDAYVNYKNEHVSIREIVSNINEEISSIQKLYNEEILANIDNMTPEHFSKIISLKEEQSYLRQLYDNDGNKKTGDELKIAEALIEYDKNKEKLYDIIVDNNAFNIVDEKMKTLYGEESEQYKTWYANNTKLTVKDDYYREMGELLKEKMEILETINENQEVSELYQELSKLSKPYKDKDGFIVGSRVPQDVALKIKNLQKKIDEIQEDTIYSPLSGLTKAEHNEITILNYHIKNKLAYYITEDDVSIEINPRRRRDELYEIAKIRKEEQSLLDDEFATKVDRLKEINKILGSMSKYTLTKYYMEELKKREEQFAMAKGITYVELKKNKEYYKEFRETEWFINNHKIDETILYEDPETGEKRGALNVTPNYQWRRNMPVKDYIEVTPGNHFTKVKLKEYYTDEAGNKVYLKRSNNRDVKGRLKPKTNDDYRSEYNTNHPYLNKDYKNLKDNYETGRATTKERVNYENLLFIEQKMNQYQEGLPTSQALGMAVPFMEKTKRERISNPKGVLRGVKRSILQTKQDMDQYGIAGKDNEADIDEVVANIQGEELKFVPVRYSTKGEAKDVSYNVWNGMLKYLSHVERKKALDTELAVANGLVKTLERNQPINPNKVDRTKQNVFKRFLGGAYDKTSTFVKGTKNLRYKVIQSFIDTTFYNEDYFDGYTLLGINSHKLIGNLSGMSSYISLGLAPLNWATNAISGNLQNLVMAAGKQFFPKSDLLWAKRVIYGDWIAGGTKYGNVMNDHKKDFAKLGNLSFWGQMYQVYDPIQGEFENEFGEKTKWSNLINPFQVAIFAGKQFGEWEIQSTAFLAYLKNNKLYKDPATNEYAVYNSEQFITMKFGNQNIEEMDPREITKIKLQAIEEFDKLEDNLITIMELNKDGKLQVKDKFKNAYKIGDAKYNSVVGRLHGMQKKINGSYAKYDKTYAEKTTLGRLTFFFRKYFVPIGVNHWGTRRVDWETESLEEGFLNQTMWMMLENYKTLGIKLMANWGNLSDAQKKSIKRTMIIGGYSLLTNLLIVPVLFGFDDDDDDKWKKLKKESIWKQRGLFVALKVKSEAEQFFPFSGFNELIRVWKNMSLVVGELVNLIKFTALGLGHLKEDFIQLFDEKYKDEDLYYDKNVGDAPWMKRDQPKIKKLFYRLFGVTGATFYTKDAIKNFTNAQENW